MDGLGRDGTNRTVSVDHDTLDYPELKIEADRARRDGGRPTLAYASLRGISMVREFLRITAAGIARFVPTNLPMANASCIPAKQRHMAKQGHHGAPQGTYCGEAAGGHGTPNRTARRRR